MLKTHWVFRGTKEKETSDFDDLLSIFAENINDSIYTTTFVVNPLIVKHFRPKDSYLKRLIIGIIADKAAGFIVGKVTK